ncbi:MAG: 16S rRNA (cytidine(1402)-2'-O)-methyltransferase [Sphaerochaetaceae bacterium]|nr:16S rRNA (cytidine(1402)-2'-O)-methyltransferase [Sphaerochaetaceae bacterium]
MSTLYMVATPIGNLEDITLRALKVLESVDIVACEDTRHTGLLLSHFNLKKRTIACHAHNETESSKGIISLLEQGHDIAYCSDAGTPGISDPGARLSEAVRKAGFTVVPIPGCSAVITLLSAAGNVGRTFTFEGFLSPKKGRRTKRLANLISRGETFVFYESPFRILKTLEEIRELSPSCRISIGRELTKAFEEIIVGDVTTCIDSLKSRDAIKGEFAVAVTPQSDENENDNDKED